MDKQKIKGIIKEYLPFSIFVLIIICVRIFVCSPINVNGKSMSTTLSDGDIMLLNKIGLKDGIKRFDIVVVKSDGNYLIKRVIGLPNEILSYEDEKLYINGKVVEDKYNLNITGDIEPIKMGVDEYYVMGDNRNISKDSRMIGTIKKDKILGKTNFVIYPFNKFGKVEK